MVKSKLYDMNIAVHDNIVISTWTQFTVSSNLTIFG